MDEGNLIAKKERLSVRGEEYLEVKGHVRDAICGEIPLVLCIYLFTNFWGEIGCFDYVIGLFILIESLMSFRLYGYNCDFFWAVIL